MKGKGLIAATNSILVKETNRTQGKENRQGCYLSGIDDRQRNSNFLPNILKIGDNKGSDLLVRSQFPNLDVAISTLM